MLKGNEGRKERSRGRNGSRNKEEPGGGSVCLKDINDLAAKTNTQKNRVDT